MVATDTVLLGAVVVLLFVVLWLLWSVRRNLGRSGEVDTDQVSAAIGETWRDLEFDKTVNDLENHAREIREFHSDLTQMLRHPQRRGQFGEQQLDLLLGDHLPQEMYGIREQVIEGKTPDAYIETSEGLICIDAKFPLDNYEAYLDAGGGQQYKRQFRADVEGQLDKIASDYVRPEAGTAPFAFAFIPSESVYYHLVTEEYDLLREFTGRGVQVVSPLTLGHKLELIRADVHAQHLSEQAAEIQERLQHMGSAFEDFADDWGILQTHIRNAESKAEDVGREFRNLQAEFDRVDYPDLEEDR